MDQATGFCAQRLFLNCIACACVGIRDRGTVGRSQICSVPTLELSRLSQMFAKNVDSYIEAYKRGPFCTVFPYLLLN